MSERVTATVACNTTIMWRKPTSTLQLLYNDMLASTHSVQTTHVCEPACSPLIHFNFQQIVRHFCYNYIIRNWVLNKTVHFHLKGMVLRVTQLNRTGLWRQGDECIAGFVCDIAEQSRAFKGRVVNAVLGLKEFKNSHYFNCHSHHPSNIFRVRGPLGNNAERALYLSRPFGQMEEQEGSISSDGLNIYFLWV